MKAIIIDDEKAMHLIMRRNLAKIASVEVVGAFLNTASALVYLEANEADLAFVDISMPQENGMKFAKRLTKLHPRLYIVFVTSHQDYAVEAFDISALDYMVKPVSLDRIRQSVDRALSKHQADGMMKEREQRGEWMIYGLGGLELRRDQAESVKWPSSKGKELFGYLLLHSGRMVSRAKIIGDLFGDLPQRNADLYLNTSIYKLRQALNSFELKGIVLSDQEGYGLELRGMPVDYVLFKQRAEQWKQGGLEEIEQALTIEAMYAGDLFGEKGYLWALPEIQRLALLHKEFVWKLSRFLLEAERAQEAAILLNKLMKRNELEEETVQLLMQAYAAQSDRESLLALYRGYEELLLEELGVKPSPGMAILFKELAGPIL